MSLGRRYYVSRDVLAGCWQCWGGDYHWHGPNAQAVAARHHDATGHTTWVDVNMSIQYGEDRDDKKEFVPKMGIFVD